MEIEVDFVLNVFEFKDLVGIDLIFSGLIVLIDILVINLLCFEEVDDLRCCICVVDVIFFFVLVVGGLWGDDLDVVKIF